MSTYANVDIEALLVAPRLDDRRDYLRLWVNAVLLENYQLACRVAQLKCVAQDILEACDTSGQTLPNDYTGIQLDRLRAAIAGTPLPLLNDFM